MNNQFLIDPGHGGQFAGAVVTVDGKVIAEEKRINLTASFLLRDIMWRRGHMPPKLTRISDRDLGPTVDIDLRRRCEMEHEEDPSCFISIHCNAFSDPTVRGFEIWTSPGQTKSDDLAECIYNKIESGLNPKMRSDTEDGDHDREGHLYVLKNTKGPAVLLELGFMTNPAELQLLKTKGYLNAMMELVADGIEEWLSNTQGES